MNCCISVVMSIYDEPIEWIKSAVDSILQQTYSNFEFIIINDNPKREENYTILNCIKASDPRISIYHNEENIGLAASLNKGISKAKGDFIARMDADDISLPLRFETQMDFFGKNPDVGVCGTFARQFDEYGKLGRKIILRKKDAELKKAIRFFCPFVHPTVMIRKELLQHTKYDTRSRTGEDWLLWKSLSPLTKFANIDKVLLHYRINPNNSTQKVGAVKTRDSRMYAALKAFDELGLSEDLKDVYCKFSCKEKISLLEFDTLFYNLYRLNTLKNSRFYLINFYQKNIIKFGFYHLLNNRLIRRNPFLYFYVLSRSFIDIVKSI